MSEAVDGRDPPGRNGHGRVTTSVSERKAKSDPACARIHREDELRICGASFDGLPKHSAEIFYEMEATTQDVDAVFLKLMQQVNGPEEPERSGSTCKRFVVTSTVPIQKRNQAGAHDETEVWPPVENRLQVHERPPLAGVAASPCVCAEAEQNRGSGKECHHGAGDEVDESPEVQEQEVTDVSKTAHKRCERDGL